MTYWLHVINGILHHTLLITRIASSGPRKTRISIKLRAVHRNTCRDWKLWQQLVKQQPKKLRKRLPSLLWHLWCDSLAVPLLPDLIGDAIVSTASRARGFCISTNCVDSLSLTHSCSHRGLTYLTIRPLCCYGTVLQVINNDLPTTLDSMERASLEFEELGQSLNGLTGALWRTKPASSRTPKSKVKGEEKPDVQAETGSEGSVAPEVAAVHEMNAVEAIQASTVNSFRKIAHDVSALAAVCSLFTPLPWFLG